MPTPDLQPVAPPATSAPSAQERLAPLDDGTLREIEAVLEMARSRLDMNLAWLSESTGHRLIVRAVAGDADSFGIAKGSSIAPEGSYSARVLDGRLPTVIPDTAADSITAGLAMTHRLGVGSYVGVPIELADGHVFGALCCVSHLADPRLSQRDAWSLTPMAQLLSGLVDRANIEFERRRQQEARINQALSGEGRTTVFQPIVDLATLAVLGLEALTRFRNGVPSDWFNEAEEVGLGLALELAAISDAVRHLDELPDDVYLSVNASPVTAGSALLEQRLASCDGRRVVVDITRDAQCQDYHVLNVALAKLRALGIRVAVDDAGSDFAGLSQILELPPDFIKLDIETVRGIDRDPIKAALAASLINFARQLQAEVVAVGIETQSELATLRSLGVGLGQGFLFARPGPLPQRDGGVNGRASSQSPGTD